MKATKRAGDKASKRDKVGQAMRGKQRGERRRLDKWNGRIAIGEAN